MGGIYWLISQVMLFWHSVWDRVLPDGALLGTDWQWVLAIVFLVVTVRIVLFPVFVKQIKSQRAMQVLQPKMKELQEKYKGDRETLQKEVMKLYQTEKVNPLMGCLPLFLQIPVFIGLLHVLRHLKPGIADENKLLYGWSLSEFNSAVVARLFDAPIAAKFSSSNAEITGMEATSTTVKIVSAVLVLLMITTTYLTQRQMIKKTGWNEDPQQRMIQKFMLYGIPFFTLTSGWIFPIGVIIYWVTNNFITLGQQFWVLHKYPPIVTNKNLNGSAKAADAKAVPTRTGPPPKPAQTKSQSGLARKPEVPNNVVVEEPSRSLRHRLSRAARPAQPAKPAQAGSNGNKSADPVASPKALPPKPGAKPTNRKKGGPAKRQSG
jgi:YidC/Oxa1 family membrane protein insertase